jgi:hypothetical protein
MFGGNLLKSEELTFLQIADKFFISKKVSGCF